MTAPGGFFAETAGSRLYHLTFVLASAPIANSSREKLANLLLSLITVTSNSFSPLPGSLATSIAISGINLISLLETVTLTKFGTDKNLLFPNY